MIRFTVAIPAWVPVAYLAVGLALWLPLEFYAWLKVANRREWPFWQEVLRGLKHRPWVPVMCMFAWPIAIWEARR